MLFGLLQAGDHAITTTIDHNSVLRPFYHLQQFHGVDVGILVPFDCKGFVDPDEIRKRLRKNTKVVAINHASNVIGTVQPLKAIGSLCRSTAFTWSSMRVAVGRQGANRRSGDEHLRGLFHGAQVAHGTDGHRRGLHRGGRGGSSHPSGRNGSEVGAARASRGVSVSAGYGTPNTVGIAGLHAGVNWVQQRGVASINDHEMGLMTRLRDGLRAIDGVTLICQDDLTDHIAVLLFNIDGLEAGDTGTMLDVDHNIACRTGLHCAPLVHEQLGTAAIHGGVRFGIGAFNTETDIDHAIVAVSEIATSVRARSMSRVSGAVSTPVA